MREVMTASAKQTQKIARMLAGELTRAPSRGGARVIALQGDLGAGKTTFTQGFARALGIRENVLSPTFVLMKIYNLRQATSGKRQRFRHLVHIDCYRIASPKDLLHLGLREILKDRDAIILIEWADRIKKIIPPDAIWLKFAYGAHASQRTIILTL